MTDGRAPNASFKVPIVPRPTASVRFEPSFNNPEGQTLKPDTSFEIEYSPERMAKLFAPASGYRPLPAVEANPFALNDLIRAATHSVRIDEGADPVRAANALRAAADTGLQTFTLPVEFIERDGQSALELAPEAEPILDYFRGTGPPPPPPTTAPEGGTSDSGTDAGSDDASGDGD